MFIGDNNDLPRRSKDKETKLENPFPHNSLTIKSFRCFLSRRRSSHAEGTQRRLERLLLHPHRHDCRWQRFYPLS